MKKIMQVIIALSLLPLSGLALAHTGSHESMGLLSGLLHPVLGMDHLVAMLAIGLWLGMSTRQNSWLPMAAFSLCMLAGVFLAVGGGLSLGSIDIGVALSLLVVGLLLASKMALPVAFSAILISLFALFHGGAHGVEMPFSASPLLYGLGFLLSTAALQGVGLVLGRMVQQARTEWLLRSAGLAASGFGAWLLLSA
ncbi:MAG: HupE/UreJ family protein [Gammaproteobacteria bacterium]|nr:HupE/UreJ family protein [Gammaproteobacteria bacterium]